MLGKKTLSHRIKDDRLSIFALPIHDIGPFLEAFLLLWRLMGYIDDAMNRVYGRFYEYEGVEPKKAKAVAEVRRKSRYSPPADHPWRRRNPSLHHNSYLERI